MKINWPRSLDLVLADKHDQIARGIPLELFQSEYGEDKTQEDLENITGDVIAEIYKKFYWDECLCDDLPGGVDYMIFDAAVYFGKGSAMEWLRGAVGFYVKEYSQPSVMLSAKKFNHELTIYKINMYEMRYLYDSNIFDKHWGHVSRVLQSALEMRY